MPTRLARRTRASFALTSAFLLIISTVACDDSTSQTDSSSPDAAFVDSTADAPSDSAADTPTPADSGVDSSVDAPLPPDAVPWVKPACTQITGMAGVTFSSDEGKTLTPTAGTLSGVAYTMGIVALARGNTLVAQHGDALWRSTDSGCNWSELAKSGLLDLASSGDVTYGWGDNRAELVRVEGSTVTKLTAPLSNIHGLGVDPLDPKHLRIGGAAGKIYDSTNGGGSFTQLLVNKPPIPTVLNYRVAFDPSELDHLAYGVANDGVIVTSDAGKSWTKATGLSQSGKANIFSIAISPTRGNIVWAMGLEPSQQNPKRKIFRSADGGKTFSAVVSEAATIPMSNGTKLWPHPTNADVVYFAHGSRFSGGRLMRYDHATGKVTSTTNSYHGIDSLTFNRADPSVLYIGLDWKDFI